jgi:hypothetical protein
VADQRREREPGADDGARAGSYARRVAAPWRVLAAVFLVAGLTTAWDASAGPFAPEFHLQSTGFEHGVGGAPAPVDLHALRGKVVVIDLMAVSCEACRNVTDNVLHPLWREFGQRPDFAMVSIDAWADPETGSGTTMENWASLVAWQSEHNATWPHALDTDHVWRKYDALALPRLVVAGPAGRILFDVLGEAHLPDVRQAVDAALRPLAGAP